MDPFVVVVSDLLRRPGSRRHEHLEKSLPTLAVTGAAVPAGTVANVDAVLDSIHEGILVTGRVSAAWQGECRRCLGRVGGELRAGVQELFEPRPTEGETYPLDHDHIDLGPMVRDALLLELPLAPLCAEGCQGICPTCGADLNDGPCECLPAGHDPRWAALDGLLQDGEAGA
jgi:uncharacterized protein